MFVRFSYKAPVLFSLKGVQRNHDAFAEIAGAQKQNSQFSIGCVHSLFESPQESFAV